jgi:hypothetical protein
MFLVRCECPANDLGSKILLTNVREYPQEMRRLLPRIILIVSLAVSNPDQGPPRPPSTRLPASLQHKLAAKDRPDHPKQECSSKIDGKAMHDSILGDMDEAMAIAQQNKAQAKPR